MKEVRVVVKDLGSVKSKLESLGAEFKDDYSFNIVIFVPSGGQVSKEYLRLKVYEVNNWDSKGFILTHKKKDNGWKCLLKKEFDTEEEVMNFIHDEFKGFEMAFEFFREGWQYQLGDVRIFVEDVKGFKPSVEIEAETRGDLDKVLKEFEVIETLEASMAEIMENYKNE